MSADNTVTEREAVERERKAFWRGVAELHIQPEIPGGFTVGEAVSRVERKAERFYPLPKITRPRVWEEKGGMAFKIVDGELWWTCTLNTSHVNWRRDDPREVTHEITIERIRAWADLLANPTEEVDA